MTAALTAHVPARALLVEVAAPGRSPGPRWEIIWDGVQGTASTGRRYELHAARAMAVECGAHEIEERALA